MPKKCGTHICCARLKLFMNNRVLCFHCFLSQFTRDESPFNFIFEKNMDALRAWVRMRRRRRRTLDKLLSRDVTYESVFTYEFGKVFRGTTPLWGAIILEFFEGAAFLTESGANVDAKCTVRVFFPVGTNTYRFCFEERREGDDGDEFLQCFCNSYAPRKNKRG